MRLRPFEALRPAPELCERVASVPYDTINTAEARELADGNPYSFLHVIRPEIDLPEGTDVHADAVYEKAKENFDRFQAEQTLIREASPCLYVYRQQMGDHVQHGVVGCCHIDDYRNNLILKHEKTRQDKEDDRTRHVRTLQANAGPVFLTYRDDKGIDALVSEIETADPVYDLEAADGVRHTVWIVQDTQKLMDAFAAVPVAYVADGHHRSAAAARAGEEMRAGNSSHTGDEEYNSFLTVLFPGDQLKILPYNRVVHDLNGLTVEAFLEKVKEHFSIVETESLALDGPRQLCMYLEGKWYRLSWDEVSGADPVAALDVSYLQSRLLAPVLGIDDPRTSTRIDFIGGIRGTDELVRLVDSGKGAVAFSMYPVTTEQMMSIADADCIMPPKSTWFEPKLRSGLLVHTL